MPELINDVDDNGKFIVRWAVRCGRCRHTQKSDTPDTPKDWEEGAAPTVDGRTPVRCPDCRE